MKCSYLRLVGIAKKNPIMEQRFFYMFYFIYRFYDRLRLIKVAISRDHRDLQIELVILKILSKSKRSRDH